MNKQPKNIFELVKKIKPKIISNKIIGKCCFCHEKITEKNQVKKAKDMNYPYLFDPKRKIYKCPKCESDHFGPSTEMPVHVAIELLNKKIEQKSKFDTI